MNWTPDELKLINQYENRSKEDPNIFYSIADSSNRVLNKASSEIVRICLATAYVQKQKVVIKIDQDLRSMGFTIIIYISSKFIKAYKETEITYGQLISQTHFRTYVKELLEKKFDLPKYLVDGLIIEVTTI